MAIPLTPTAPSVVGSPGSELVTVGRQQRADERCNALLQRALQPTNACFDRVHHAVRNGRNGLLCIGDRHCQLGHSLCEQTGDESHGQAPTAKSRTRRPLVMADRSCWPSTHSLTCFPRRTGTWADVIGGREGDDLVPVQETEVADILVRVAHSDAQYDGARQCAQVGWSVGPVSGEQDGQSGQGGTVRVQALVLLAANGVQPQRSASVLLSQPYDGVSSHVAVRTSHNQTPPAESIIVAFRGSPSFPSFDHFRVNEERLMDPLTLPLGVRRHGSGTLRMDLTRRRPKKRRGGVAGRTGA